jgi:hypothetical protein
MNQTMNKIRDEEVTINSILDKFLDTHRTQNIELLSEIFSHDKDMINFGSDADEIFHGWDELKASFLKQFESFEKLEVSFRNRNIRIANSGNAAWYSEILDFNIIIKGKPVIINGFRHTGVMEKRDNKWIIAQFHYSVPVQGQAVEY